jgi:hypothetical protein
VEIKIQLPRPHDADIEYDKSNGVLTIRPRFQNAMQTKVVQNIEVVGKSGRSLKFQTSIAGASGRIKVETVKEATSAFDALPKEEVPK